MFERAAVEPPEERSAVLTPGEEQSVRRDAQVGHPAGVGAQLEPQPAGGHVPDVDDAVAVTADYYSVSVLRDRCGLREQLTGPIRWRHSPEDTEELRLKGVYSGEKL